mgnify:CR=1 FL=1
MSEKKRSAKEFFMDNNKKNLKIFIIVVVAILVLAAVTMGIYVFAKVGLINIDKDGKVDPDYTLAPEDEFDNMYDAADTSGLDALITAWAKNGGAKYSSKNIINVLLLGVDSETGKAEGGRSDAIILLSLNKKTKTITLVSFLRDCYTYMNINGSERCCKTNHAYFWGGPAALIETLENNYKIEIDHYISVDFKSFPKLIDSLGGVSVPIEPYEADYINRTTTKIKKITSGDSVKLSGRQALVYSRIRHVDNEGDVGRTARQRTIITALIKSAQGASLGQLNNAMDIVLPNVHTNYGKGEIISLLTQAFAQKWMNYDIAQMVMPSEGNYVAARLYTYYGRVARMQLDTWVIDYPVAARELQLALYGKTNINIGSDHVSAIDLYNQGLVPTLGGSTASGTRAQSSHTAPAQTSQVETQPTEAPAAHETTSPSAEPATAAEPEEAND